MEKKCIKISNIKISPDKDTAFLEGFIRKELRLGKDAQIDYEIAKRSLDCRHKPQVMHKYSVEVYKVVRSGREEKLENIIKNSGCKNAIMSKRVIYKFPVNATENVNEDERPVVIGFGPAGIFCALELAKAGLDLLYMSVDRMLIQELRRLLSSGRRVSLIQNVICS